MKIMLIGFGVVGQGVAGLLGARPQLDIEIVGVATGTRGSLYLVDGLSPHQLLTAIQSGHLDHYPDAPGLRRNLDPLQLIRDSKADVMVECSPSNFQTGQPAFDYCRAAFASGKHVVLANKGPVALRYANLMGFAGDQYQVRYEATVMAGTPCFALGEKYFVRENGCPISDIRGILNGTTNYILTQMGDGMNYAEALAQAQQLGYAETDPTADVEGWDAAGKAMILSNVFFGNQLRRNEMSVQGITGITQADIASAHAAGERWKLIVQVTPAGASVQPMRLPISDPLAGVSGATNAITFKTPLLGDVTLIGAGAGRAETAFGVLADLLDIQRTLGR
jgi:homoserine dehydrogenase